ncbi:hypothetical protein L0244_06070 [bacterium]|nr:hypothetical protein [bacterium]
MPTKKELQFNTTVASVLDGGATDNQYLQITIPASKTHRFINAIYASYVPNTGGLVTNATIRTGKLIFGIGDFALIDGVQLDPFSPLIIPNNTERMILQQVFANRIVIEFPKPVEVIESAVSVAIGRSVGEGDISTAPTPSVGYLTLIGRETLEGAEKPFPFILR